MKTTLLLAALAVGAWVLTGCATSNETVATEDLPTYQCSKCKETVSWAYKGPRFSKLSRHRRKVKTVTHECPACTKTWGANLSVETACDECQEEHLKCPICKKHG